MAVAYRDVVDIRRSLEDDYREYHEKFQKLRDIYHGRYWQVAERDSQARSISSIFRDLGRANRTSLPPIRIIRNIIQEVCVKYQSYMSEMPMVNYFTDVPESFERRQEMSVKERYTYGIWRAGKMTMAVNNVAWYSPLMGDAFMGIYPDMKRSIPVPVIRDPEHAYPIPGFGGETLGHIFFWRDKLSNVRRAFPEYADQITSMTTQSDTGRPDSSGSDPIVDIYEYSDENEFARWCAGVKVVGVEHNFGYDLFAHTKFIDIPGDVFGHSAVEQAVNLNEADNMITSLLFQAMLENIFPTIVLIDPAKAPEQIMKGPGSIIPLNPGGDMKIIAPPVQAVATQLEYLAQNKTSIQEMTGMPAVNFGTSPASSIVTGAAVSQLQGAGTGSTVQMVQQGFGLVMSQWCEKAIHMQRTMWSDTEITLNYVTPLTKKGGKESQGSMTMKGSDLEGGTANEIVWSPAMDIHDKLVMWLQAKGAGLVSDEYILKQVGIADPEAMQEEIFQEEMQRAVLGFIVQSLTSPTPDTATAASQAGTDFLEGTGGGAATPSGAPGMGGTGAPSIPGLPPGAALPTGAPSGPPPGGGPPGGPTSLSGGNLTGPLGGGGTVKAPPLALPQGAPVPAGAAAAPQLEPQPGGVPGQPPTPSSTPTGPTGGQVSLNQAVSALSGGDYSGRVFLVGTIVTRGMVNGPIDVAVTDPNDRQVVAQTAPQYTFTFHVVQGVPAEHHVEVTGQPEQAEQPETPEPGGG